MTFTAGDHVAYSVQWLRSVGMSHTPLAHARGVVTDVRTLGSATLVCVDWDDVENTPPRVNAANLAHVGANTRFANC